MNLLSAEDIQNLSPEQIAERMNDVGAERQTLGCRMGIRLTFASPERMEAVMPVVGNQQPFGRLHGGANVVLAEEIASVGSLLNVDPSTHAAVGVDISATHLRGVTGGEVRAVATRVYRGRTTLVWSIEIMDERGKLSCVSRCTLQVIRR